MEKGWLDCGSVAAPTVAFSSLEEVTDIWKWGWLPVVGLPEQSREG